MTKDGQIIVAIIVGIILYGVLVAVKREGGGVNFDYMKERARLQAESRADAPRMDACLDVIYDGSGGQISFDEAWEACSR